MLKRVFALILALVMVLAVTACGKGDKARVTVTLSSAEQEALNQAAAGLEDKELANKKLRWFSHWDVWPEGQEPTPAVYLATSKYGIEFEWIQTTWANRYTDLANLVLAGNSPDYFTAGDMDAFPRAAIQEMAQPVEGYFDLTKPLWTEIAPAWDTCSWNGKQYVAIIDIAPNSVWAYNKTTFEEYGLPDPAELYYKGEWDWNAFKEMAQEFVDEENNMYAIDGWFFEYGFINGAGVTAIEIDNGIVKHNFNNPQFEKACLFMEELVKMNACWPRHLKAWALNPTGVADGTTLFYDSALWEITKSDMFGPMSEIMFVPAPKDPDLDYHPVAMVFDGFMLCKDAPNPEAFAAYMECLRYSYINPEVQEVGRRQDIEKGWTDEMFEMKASIKEAGLKKPIFQFFKAVTPEIETLARDAEVLIMIPAEQTWAEIKAQYEEPLQYYIDKVNNK